MIMIRHVERVYIDADVPLKIRIHIIAAYYACCFHCRLLRFTTRATRRVMLCCACARRVSPRYRRHYSLPFFHAARRVIYFHVIYAATRRYCRFTGNTYGAGCILPLRAITLRLHAAFRWLTLPPPLSPPS